MKSEKLNVEKYRSILETFYKILFVYKNFCPILF